MTNNSDQIPFNADGQKQLDQYKNAFDNLRSAIDNLNRPLNDISKAVSPPAGGTRAACA